MDDGRIRQLTGEVLSQIRGAASPESADLEGRVAALEAAVRSLQGSTAATTAVVVTHTHAHPHPSLQVLGVPAGADRCCMEPDKPCVQSGQCRVLGH